VHLHRTAPAAMARVDAAQDDILSPRLAKFNLKQMEKVSDNKTVPYTCLSCMTVL